MGLRGLKKRKRRCVYCGYKAMPGERKGWPDVCRLHADLPASDPSYPDLAPEPSELEGRLRP